MKNFILGAWQKQKKVTHIKQLTILIKRSPSSPITLVAYLARGITRYQMFDRQGATQDAQMAQKLYLAQNNSTGLQTVQAFIQEMKIPSKHKK